MRAPIPPATDPSYGYMVANPHEPSTTLWENWAADHLDKDQADASRNHIMFGTISAFLWKHIAGLTPPPPAHRSRIPRLPC